MFWKSSEWVIQETFYSMIGMLQIQNESNAPIELGSYGEGDVTKEGERFNLGRPVQEDLL